MVGNGEASTSVTVARETWICHVSIFALDAGQLRAKFYATHSLKSSLLKSCFNYPSLHPHIPVHPVIVFI